MSDGEEDKNKAEEHEKKFKEMRKKHYNEAEMMRKWREEHANTGDDEEDEDAEMKD
jgi:protein phosphatase inhibitor 2